jgi:hypothetical protein
MNDIRKNFYNENYTQFCLEDAQGNSMVATRINQWQWNVEFETAKGFTNYYERVDHAIVIRWAADMIGDDENCSYNSRIKSAV